MHPLVITPFSYLYSPPLIYTTSVAVVVYLDRTCSRLAEQHSMFLGFLALYFHLHLLLYMFASVQVSE